MRGIIVVFISMFIFLVNCKKDNSQVQSKVFYILPFNKINKIYIDNAGIKWIATDSGIVSYNGKTLTLYTEPAIDKIGILDIAFEKFENNNNFWLATKNGTSKLSYQGTSILSSNSYKMGSSGLLSNNIYSVGVDNSNTKYFGTDSGLSIFTGTKWDTFYGKQQFGENDLLKNFKITDIASSDSGWVYVATMGGGITKFKYELDAVTGATIINDNWPNAFSQLQTNNVFAVAVLNDTSESYGTDKGVIIHTGLSIKSGWQTFTTSNGLICDTVYAIAEDKSKNIWFGTPSGVSKFDGNSWVNYTKSNGLVSNKINTIAIDIDGSVWFGTDNGISRFSDNNWTNYSHVVSL